MRHSCQTASRAARRAHRSPGWWDTPAATRWFPQRGLALRL